jgi:hypothetical protein
MKLRKMFPLLFAALLAICGLRAQTADDIINKHIAAMGGADKLKGLKTMYTEGMMEMRGMEIPLKLWIVNDKAMRMEFEVMGSKNIQVVTKTGGWMLMPFQGPDPKEMDSSMVRSMLPRLDVTGELFDYKSKGKKINLEGKETTNGLETYKLRISGANSQDIVVFVDANTYYISKMQTRVNVQGQDMEVTTLLTDYKKTDNGFVYPGTTTQEPIGNKISATKVEVNKQVDDTLFAMPKKKS